MEHGPSLDSKKLGTIPMPCLRKILVETSIKIKDKIRKLSEIYLRTRDFCAAGAVQCCSVRAAPCALVQWDGSCNGGGNDGQRQGRHL